MKAKPFPRHIAILCSYEGPSGTLKLEGPAHLFEPEHLQPGSVGAFGGAPFRVETVETESHPPLALYAKVTAKRVEQEELS